jgi:hypothetical protein
MIYAYRTGALLPEGCVGHYVTVTTHNYSSELFGDAGLVMQSQTQLDMSRKKVLDGAIVDMTPEECAIMDAKEASEAAAAEVARQAAKSAELKAAENRFFALCAAVGLSGKPGFDALNAAILALKESDPDTARDAAIELLAIDAECKREGGLSWWDDAAYHAEIVQ